MLLKDNNISEILIFPHMDIVLIIFYAFLPTNVLLKFPSEYLKGLNITCDHN
jgi:hypothetical protein